MQNIAIFEASSEVIKFLTLGAPSSVKPFYNSHHPLNRGVVGHNIDRCITRATCSKLCIPYACGVFAR